MPQVLLMENVTQIHSKKNIEDFKKWINFLESLGYSNYYQDLNAKNYGIPQNRDRTFMVSLLGNYYYEFPKPFKLELRLKDMLEDEVDEKYYLSDKMIEYLTGTNQKRGVVQKGMSQTIKCNPNDLGVVVNATHRDKISLKRGYNVEVKKESPDTTEIDVIGNYSKSNYNVTQINDKEDKKISLNTNYKKLIDTIEKNVLPIGEVKHMDLYNRNLTDNCGTLNDPCHNNNRLWDGLRIRKLTPRECFRLMGIKDESFDKIKNLSNTQAYKQAGNGIVVNVLMEIFKKLIN